MINTEIIEHACRLAIYSTKIRGEKPVSIMLLAPSEHGKSEILKKFAFIPIVKIMTDFNTFVFNEFVNEYLANQKTTIIIPDFIRITKKKYSTQSNALTILNAITEEGWIGKLPLGQIVTRPIYANVLTALTLDEMHDKRHKWAKIGFLSRFLPLSYSYKPETKTLIREYIKNRKYSEDKPYDIELDTKKVRVTLPIEIANEIQKIALSVIEQIKKENPTGFRLQRQLQTLAMANALVRNDIMVNENDVSIIRKISEFINFNYRGI